MVTDRTKKRFKLCLSIEELAILAVVNIGTVKQYEKKRKEIEKSEAIKIRRQLHNIAQAQTDYINRIPPKEIEHVYIKAPQLQAILNITFNELTAYVRTNNIKRITKEIDKVRRIKTKNIFCTRITQFYNSIDAYNVLYKRECIEKQLKGNSNNYMLNLFKEYKQSKDYTKQVKAKNIY